jgi:hypothetical protein
MIFTTSWDDANVLDYKLIKTIKENNPQIKGTVYVPILSKYRNTLDSDIKNLSEFFEIGCHTLDHRDLSKSSIKEIENQLSLSQRHLSELLKKDINAFCFPFGKYSKESVEIAKKYFKTGRIVSQNFSEGIIENDFLLHTSIQVCTHSKEITEKLNFEIKNVGSISQKILPKLKNIKLDNNNNYKWLDIAKLVFNEVKNTKSVFHLWGHSWEIEKQNLWQELGDFMRFVSTHKDIIYLDNSSLKNNIIHV